MLTRSILVLFLVLSIGCKNQHVEVSANGADKFDKLKWSVKADNDYPFRDQMLKDLMANHTKHGVKMNEILDKLGSPTRKDSLYLFYLVEQKRFGIFPLHTKTLVIKFDEDSSLAWAKIHE